MKEGTQVLIEPFEREDTTVQAAYSIGNVYNGEVMVRIANIGTESRALQGGEEIAWVTDEECNPEYEAGRLFAQGKGQDNRDWKGLCCDKLPSEKTKDLVGILRQFSSVFYDGGKLPVVKVGVEHTVRVKDGVAPQAHRPRRLSPELEKEVRKEIAELKSMGVIRESNSPWAAPIVCARRANGQLRLVIDYRGVNANSTPATLHPIPLIEDLLDRLGHAQYFSVLDAKAGYHHMPLKTSDSEITAFVTPWGKFE